VIKISKQDIVTPKHEIRISLLDYICVWFCTLRLGLHELAFHSVREYFKEFCAKISAGPSRIELRVCPQCPWVQVVQLLKGWARPEVLSLFHWCAYSFSWDGQMTKNDFVKYRGDWIEVGYPRSSWGRSTWGFIQLRKKSPGSCNFLKYVFAPTIALNCITTCSSCMAIIYNSCMEIIL
jgi:hypothetical protein